MTSWSIVDYFLRPKPAYFAIARELRPITVGMTRKDVKSPRKDKPDSEAYFEIDTKVEIWGTNSGLRPEVRLCFGERCLSCRLTDPTAVPIERQPHRRGIRLARSFVLVEGDSESHARCESKHGTLDRSCTWSTYPHDESRGPSYDHHLRKADGPGW